MNFEITLNRPLTTNVFDMRLKGDTSLITRPGQFVQMQVPGFYLRRPISVCDWSEGSLRLIYKTISQGTAAMAGMKIGGQVDLLTGLGNGYDADVPCHKPLLIGGGVGVPPLYGLCRTLLDKGADPVVILGFNTRDEVFLKEDFEQLGVQTLVTTVDGSMGEKGFVTGLMPELDYDYFFTCGPEPMLKAVWHAAQTEGQLSFEERMACGFGACMGCSCRTKYGAKRICKDGPVLKKEEVIW